MSKLLTFRWIVFALAGVMMLSVGCSGGAKKLKRKPRTHLGKEQNEGNFSKEVFMVPGPIEQIPTTTGLERKLDISGQEYAFAFGRWFSDLGAFLESLKKKDISKKAFEREMNMYSNILRELSFNLEINDQEIDNYLSVQKNDLEKVSSLYQYLTEKLIVKGKIIELELMKIGLWVEQFGRSTENTYSFVSNDRSGFELTKNKLIVQNLLNSLIENDPENEMKLYRQKLKEILDVFDGFKGSGVPEIAAKNDEGVYVITGGAVVIADTEELIKLSRLVNELRFIHLAKKDV